MWKALPPRQEQDAVEELRGIANVLLSKRPAVLGAQGLWKERERGENRKGLVGLWDPPAPKT